MKSVNVLSVSMFALMSNGVLNIFNVALVEKAVAEALIVTFELIANAVPLTVKVFAPTYVLDSMFNLPPSIAVFPEVK